MTIEAKYYMHPSDEKALAVLKAMPGFALLARIFIRYFQEKPVELLAMGNCIRVSDRQYPELYEQLDPICQRLGIKKPELFVEMNPEPNGFTIGDRNPIVVVTSGLLETLDLKDVSVVLAHECGHIACHHVLYRTIGMYLTNKLYDFITIPFPVSVGIQMAMRYWMRCSELSADRASAVCCGNSHGVIRLMMEISGGSGTVYSNFDVKEYLHQAEEYQEKSKSNLWTRFTNILITSNQDHPFAAARALEIDRWCNSSEFQKILET